MDDPRPLYAQLRADDPVHYVAEYDAWALASFDAVWQVCKDTTNFTCTKGMPPTIGAAARARRGQHLPPPRPARAPAPATRARLRVHAGGRRAGRSGHPRHRPAMCSIPWSRAATASWMCSATTRRVVAGAGRRLQGRSSRRGRGACASPVRARLRARPRTEGHVGQNGEAMMQAFGYLHQLVTSARQDPAQARAISPRCSPHDRRRGRSPTTRSSATCHTILVTGSETTETTVAAAMYYLAQHPEQRAEVTRSDHSLIPHAFVETVRFDHPTDLLCRRWSTSVEVAGARRSRRPAPAAVVGSAAATRPSTNADRFDIHRRSERSLIFGHGQHKCIGEHIGVRMGTVMLEELIPASDSFEVDFERSRSRRGEFLKGFNRMPVEVVPCTRRTKARAASGRAGSRVNFTVDEDHEAIRDGVRGVCRDFDDAYWRQLRRRARVPVGVLRGDGRGRLGRHRHPRGVRRRGPGHHRGVDRAGGGRRLRRGHERLQRDPPVDLRDEPGRQARQRRDEATAYLPRVADGELHVAFGVTEPDAGTDTTAITHPGPTLDGDDYVVRGRKVWTTKAPYCEKVLLLVRTTPLEECARRTDGMTLLLADLQRPEVDITPDPQDRPQRGGRRARCATTTCAVPVSDRVGEEGQGFRYLLDGLNPERILIAAEALGIGRVAVAPGRRLRQRARRLRPADRPEPGHRLPAGRGLRRACTPPSWSIREAAWRYDHGLPCGEQANMAKLLAADAGLRRRPGHADPRRLRLRQGVRRRALLARGPADADRADHPGDGPQLPRRARPRPAPLATELFRQTPTSGRGAACDVCAGAYGVGVARDLAGQRGPRADERHRPAEHVEQLRQLVEAVAAQERARCG